MWHMWQQGCIQDFNYLLGVGHEVKGFGSLGTKSPRSKSIFVYESMSFCFVKNFSGFILVCVILLLYGSPTLKEILATIICSFNIFAHVGPLGLMLKSRLKQISSSLENGTGAWVRDMGQESCAAAARSR